MTVASEIKPDPNSPRWHVAATVACEAGAGRIERFRSQSLTPKSKLDHNTVYGGFRVDRDGLQIAHKMLMFQWQDGKKVIVWPEELAPGRARFPTPPWSQRP